MGISALSLDRVVSRLRRGSPQDSEEVALDAAAQTASGSHGDQRLLELFKNRAELKKAFSGLNEKCEQLRDQLNEQRELTQQERHKLAALETMLGDPGASHAIMLHYQLRGLWGYGNTLLRDFARELTAQQEQRERRDLQLSHRRERDKRLNALRAKMQALSEQSRELTANLGAMVGRREGMTGFWNYFRRRKLTDQIDPLREHSEKLRLQLEKLSSQRIEMEADRGPGFDGLSTEARRSVNLAVLALAQYLYVEFSDHSLAMMARLATIHSLTEVEYGAPNECALIAQRLEQAMSEMRGRKGYADALKARARYLRKRVHYKDSKDTVPAPDSLDSFPRALNDGVPGASIDVNVMIDNYWDVVAVLLR